MPRALWSGVIGFGMVSIPIKLYAATENKSITFNQVHAKCKTKINEKRWCPKCEKEVDWDEIEKGFEYAKGKYITLTAEDMESLPLPSKNIIELSEFVKLEEIDPVYFEKSYFVEPEAQAARPYKLFIDGLKDKGMIGIGNVTLRNRERLCALRIYGDALMLCTLLHPDEIRAVPKVDLPEVKLTKQEKTMSAKLIDLLAKPFKPEKFKDHYREALTELIEAKLEGEPLEKGAEPTGKHNVVDLMDALRASISDAKGERSGKRTAKKKSHAATAAHGTRGRKAVKIKCPS
jgi:DNA end-binding protein Ku